MKACFLTVVCIYLVTFPAAPNRKTIVVNIQIGPYLNNEKQISDFIVSCVNI